MPDRSETVTTRSKAYKELRRSIITGHRKPGERLDPNELARAYNSSITPLRDALQMLAQEGLVTIKSRCGYFVSRLTLKELHELFEVREILETAVIERAVPRITDECLQQLTHVHAGYTDDDDESYDRYIDENRRFHYLLAQASGNHELAEMLVHLLDRLARFMVLLGAGKTQEDSHARIIQAIRARDVARACQLTREELEAAREGILHRVMREEGASWHL